MKEATVRAARAAIRPAAAFLALLFLLLFAGKTARAGGFAMTTFGSKRTGMLAVMGDPDDLTAMFHNPAGLANQPGVRLMLFAGPTFLHQSFKLQALDPVRWPEINPQGCGQPGRDPCPWPIDSKGFYGRKIKPDRVFGLLPYLAVSSDLGFIHGRLKKMVASLAFTAPNFYGAYLPENAPSAYMIIGGIFLVTSTSFGLAYKINRYISVGSSVSYNFMYLSMAQKQSTVDALTPRDEQPDSTAEFAQEILGDIRINYKGKDHGVGWNMGVIITPAEWVSIGISYAHATSARFEGKMRFKAQSENALQHPGLLNQALGVAGFKLPHRLIYEQAIPPSLFVGANFRIGRMVEVGAEVRFWFYQLYKRQKMIPIYDPDEEGEPALTTEDLSHDTRYHMSYQVNAGIMVRPFRRYPGIELMTGLGYEESPTPNETFQLSSPTMDHIKLACGVRWQIDSHWRVGLTYLAMFFLRREVTNSQVHPPNNGHGYGSSHMPSIEATYRF